MDLHDKHLGKDVVLKLVEQFSGSEREIVTDNFFTSHELVVNLLQMNLTLFGHHTKSSA